MLHAVVMAGGSGTRFWPQSRKTRPKQLMRLTGRQTLIQQTVARTSPWIPRERTWIVTNRAQAEETARQVPEVPAENMLIEPVGRNTAACIGLAAICLLEQDPQAVMLVTPADHVIGPQEAFQSAVERAVGIVEQNPEWYVLFGIPPAYPAVGYGYIERGDRLADLNSEPSTLNSELSTSGDGAFRVKAFREKPDRQTAQEYLDSGDFYWNSGIFVWRAESILEGLRQFEPEIHERLLRLRDALESDDWNAVLETEFPAMKPISIDYAVLERAAKTGPASGAGPASGVAVLEAPFEWDDVGSWQALSRLLSPDEAGNTVDGPFCGLDTRGCIIHSSDEHLIATIGLENQIVVHTPDVTLVARTDDENAIRKLVELLKEQGYGRFL